MTDIYLSINENKKVLELPIVPENYSVTSDFESREFVGVQGMFRMAGERGLTSISFSSFFPSVYYPFSRNRSMLGMDYVREIEAMRDEKIPVRLVIAAPGSQFSVNDLFYIDRFDLEGEKNGDIAYSITFNKTESVISDV